MKTCTKCKNTKPLFDFSKCLKNSDNYRSYCRECEKSYQAKYRVENSEKRKILQQKWKEKNAEKHKLYQREWYLKNKKTVLEKQREWRAKNPDAYRVYSENRRSRKSFGGGRLSPDLCEKLFKLQKGKCACCKKPLGKNYHMDHIMPLFLGGTNTDDNIQLLRSECNRQKHAKHPVEFMQQRGFLL